MKTWFASIVLSCIALCGCATTKNPQPVAPAPPVGVSPEPLKGVALPPDAAAVVEKIKPGMKYKEAHALLMSVATEYCHVHFTETLFFRTYAFSNGTEITFNFTQFVVQEHWRPGKRRRWDGRFDPMAEEVKQAVAIAAVQLQKDLDSGVDAFRDHPTDPAGRFVVGKNEQVTLTLKRQDGTPLEFKAGGTGRYINHRLIDLDLDSEAGWEHRVTVDMTDGVVVPTQWEPGEELLAKLLPVAVRETEVPARARHQAWGEYDYGPTRRLITYCLEWEEPGKPGTSVRYVTLDADRGIPFYIKDGTFSPLEPEDEE
ncbi:MAG: hypothetical protein WD768_23420 [Phycisphaeraceae bacterium]